MRANRAPRMPDPGSEDPRTPRFALLDPRTPRFALLDPRTPRFALLDPRTPSEFVTLTGPGSTVGGFGFCGSQQRCLDAAATEEW